MSSTNAMLLVCPGCGTFGSIETFAAHADAAVVTALLADMPPDVAAAMQRYVRLFAPAKHEMTWRRGRRVLEPLAPLIKAQSITVKGRAWSAPNAAWIAAVNAMMDSRTLQLPLKSNGYLYSVLAADADKAEAVQERQAQSQRQSGTQRASSPLEDAELQRANIRTATALLVNEDTIVWTRFKQHMTEDQAAEFLRYRGFSKPVIDAALAAWKGARNSA